MQILLIHGLGRTSLSLAPLAGQLKAGDHTAYHFAYLAFAESFDQIVERLRQRLRQLANRGPYGAVTHSLGGILLRVALADTKITAPNHTVMLGPPNHAPRLVAIAWKLWPFRWLTGQCGFNLSRVEFYQNLPGLRSPYTIIAGTNGPRGSLSPFGNDINDGVVALDETRLAATDKILEVPTWHTVMMNHASVQRLTLKALGRANRKPSP